MKEFPIIPNEVLKLTFGDEEDEYLLVCASHDSIQAFGDSQYDHLRYYEPEEGQLKAIWLSSEILTRLIEAGIPVTPRESITEGEYECYQKYLARVAMSCVEVEEVPEVQLTDAEIDWFWKELED